MATSTGVAPVPTQLLRTGEGIVQDPHSRSLRQLVTYKGVQVWARLINITFSPAVHGRANLSAKFSFVSKMRPARRMLLFTFHNNDLFFHWFSFKLMESGVLGAVGQSALRLVEVATKSENEPALIQPLRTVVVDAKDQTISRRAVTVNCAQVRKDTSYSRFSNT